MNVQIPVEDVLTGKHVAEDAEASTGRDKSDVESGLQPAAEPSKDDTSIDTKAISDTVTPQNDVPDQGHPNHGGIIRRID